MEWWNWVLLFIWLFFCGYIWSTIEKVDVEAAKKDIMRLTDEQFTKELNRYREEELRRMK